MYTALHPGHNMQLTRSRALSQFFRLKVELREIWYASYQTQLMRSVTVDPKRWLYEISARALRRAQKSHQRWMTDFFGPYLTQTKQRKIFGQRVRSRISSHLAFKHIGRLYAELAELQYAVLDAKCVANDKVARISEAELPERIELAKVKLTWLDEQDRIQETEIDELLKEHRAIMRSLFHGWDQQSQTKRPQAEEGRTTGATFRYGKSRASQARFGTTQTRWPK